MHANKLFSRLLFTTKCSILFHLVAIIVNIRPLARINDRKNYNKLSYFVVKETIAYKNYNYHIILKFIIHYTDYILKKRKRILIIYDFLLKFYLNPFGFISYQFRFFHLGYSHRGMIQHKNILKYYGKSYTKRCIVGVYLDLSRGHLEFYVNRM